MSGIKQHARGSDTTAIADAFSLLTAALQLYSHVKLYVYASPLQTTEVSEVPSGK